MELKTSTGTRIFKALNTRLKSLNFISDKKTLKGFWLGRIKATPHFRKLSLMVQGGMDSRKKKEGWKDWLGDYDSPLVEGDQGQVWVATVEMQTKGRGWEMKGGAGMKEGVMNKEEEKSRSNPRFELPWFWEWWWEWWKQILFFNVFISGCVRSELLHAGSLLMDPLVVAHRLSSCPAKYEILVLHPGIKPEPQYWKADF